jgi:hypothetical protein
MGEGGRYIDAGHVCIEKAAGQDMEDIVHQFNSIRFEDEAPPYRHHKI